MLKDFISQLDVGAVFSLAFAYILFTILTRLIWSIYLVAETQLLKLIVHFVYGKSNGKTN